MLDRPSQDTSELSSWVRMFPFIARLKGLANGVNPRWGTKTVVVSDTSGKVVRLVTKGSPGCDR